MLAPRTHDYVLPLISIFCRADYVSVTIVRSLVWSEQSCNGMFDLKILT
jgi:hypothetical protein